MAKVKINVLQNFNGKKENMLFEKDKQYDMDQARVNEILAFSKSLIEVIEDNKEDKPVRKPRAKKVVKETAKDGE
ncbi:hypothetical protein [Macrococcus carouselicus]|uniref:Uncharacterized protein n=1 Tax=Macrococcus carouselicus TaxID=69969 RepID=A0A9Q8CNQ6_9STAP|nr:hypothetical protein [Macrococcus carouselicus]TDM04062.1 hypothetical protein ERX40_02520 [Macrococcus carouselicus]